MFKLSLSMANSEITNNKPVESPVILLPPLQLTWAQSQTSTLQPSSANQGASSIFASLPFLPVTEKTLYINPNGDPLGVFAASGVILNLLPTDKVVWKFSWASSSPTGGNFSAPSPPDFYVSAGYSIVFFGKRRENNYSPEIRYDAGAGFASATVIRSASLEANTVPALPGTFGVSTIRERINKRQGNVEIPVEGKLKLFVVIDSGCGGCC